MNQDWTASSKHALNTVECHDQRQLSSPVNDIIPKRPRAVSPSREIWTALRKEYREIRLAHLQPSADLNDQPVVSLQIVSLDEIHEYEALSYAWGDASVTKPINLQGIQWPVTVNLEAALRYLRYPAVVRVIWIDALCINQCSIKERNYQIQLMSYLYSVASVVRVWLGGEDPGSCEAIQILKQMGERKSFADIVVAGNAIGEQQIRNVIAFLKRPWWTRIWTLQEVALARKVTIHCGYTCLDHSEFRVIYFGRRSLEGNWLRENIHDSVADEYIIHAGIALGAINLARMYFPNELENRYLFLAILGHGRFRYSSDSRDSIYGCLGLADDMITTLIVPDYEKSPAEIFTTCAIQLTLSLQSLLLFSFTTRNRDCAIKTPSWVPTWEHLEVHSEEGRTWTNRMKRANAAPKFSASMNTTMKFDVMEGLNVRVSGLSIGCVAYKSSTSLKRIQFLLEIKDTLKEWRQRFCVMLPKGTSDMGANFTKLVMNDTIEVDSEGQYHWQRCLPEVIEEFSQWLIESKISIARTEILDALYRACFDRHFFVTDNGYAGLGPTELQAGDSVYVLAGGPMLYILRPVPGASRPRTFTLIGDCYVQGVMDGEAVKGHEEDFHDIVLE